MQDGKTTKRPPKDDEDRVPELTVLERLATGGNISLLEFAAWAGISIRTVYNELDAGRLRASRIGRRRIVTAEAARAWQRALTGDKLSA